jgi:1,4-dihydroxy-2-naphthoate octaprenyltransferase
MNRWVLGARPRTLPAAVVPVLVGTATAAGGGIHWWRAGVAMVVALAIQVATNYANDYADGVRGTDDVRVGPVRLVASRLASPAEVIGAASLAAGYLYTGGPRPYGYAGLGEVFVFLFFGVVATVGSSYVQLDRVTLLAVAASVPVGFLATALLVVNNLRDIRTDGAAGKRTLAVRVGEPATRALYGGLVVGAFLVVPVLALRRPLALLALLAAPLAARPLRLVSGTATARALLPALADTARLALVFGVLLAAGLALSA